MEAKEPDEDKKPRIYKGEIKKVSQLPAESFSVVQVMPDTRDLLQKLIKARPLFMVVERVQQGIKPGEKVVTYRDPRAAMVQRMVYIRNDAELNVLTGTQGKAITDEYLAWRDKQPIEKWVGSIGCDPEVFVEDEDGNVIPAWTFLGSKNKPTRAYAVDGGNTNVYWDGFQAEFSTRPGTTCLAYLCDHVQEGLRNILTAARKKNKKAKLSNAAVLPVSLKDLENGADEHVQFGCMPSKNVYGIKGKTEDGRVVPYRFAGGHLHFGFSGGTPEPKKTEGLIRALDAVTGVACVSLFAEYDSPVRREYYGLAGEYRTPTHGIEYRTLSNAWCMHPLLMNIVYELSRRAMALYLYSDFSKWKATEEETIITIQTCDVDRARRIMRDNEALLARMMAIPTLTNPGLFAKILQGGCEVFIAEPHNLHRNWEIDTQMWTNHCESPNKNWNKASATIAAGGKV